MTWTQPPPATQEEGPPRWSALANTLTMPCHITDGIDAIRASLKEKGNAQEHRDYAYYAEHGQEMAVTPRNELPDEVRRKYDALAKIATIEANACYHNVGTFLLRAHRSEDLTWCEGVMVSEGNPHIVQHAWLRLDDYYVDPTRDYVLKNHDETTYFGVEFPTEFTITTLVAEKWYRPIALGPARPRKQLIWEDQEYDSHRLRRQQDD